MRKRGSEETVDRYLDALHDRTHAEVEVDPAVAATIRHLIAMTPKTAPPGARERVWQRLTQADVAAASDRPPAPVQTRRGPNWRDQLHPARWEACVRPAVELTVMAIVLLGLLGAMALGRGHRLPWPAAMNEPGVSPSAPAIAATPVTPAIAWQFQAGAPLASQAVVSGPLVYVTSADGQLHAVDAKTGKERWHVPVGRLHLSTRGLGPAVAGGSVYICGQDGRLWALNAFTGSERWRVPLHGPVCVSPPTVAAGVVLVASSGSVDTYLDVIDAQTGHLLWSDHGLGGSVAGWAVANGVVFLANDNKVDALSLTTGRPLWHFTAGIFLGRPLVAGNTVYVGGEVSSTVIALDAATGHDRWRAALTGIYFIWPGVVANSLLYLNATSEVNSPGAASTVQLVLVALDASTGAEHWRHTVNGIPWAQPAPPTVHAGLVYAGMGTGMLIALDATTGHERWHVQIGATTLRTPTVTADAIYIGSDDHILYALRVP